ncbi:hypothetical protein [Sphaerisporangium perillae]|uniref:hypothetical protein n=1 Tax=Sphaerisporangium perillae TaxID=2935860 RepID=UPI00200E768E|nr:hypothetical protein [Sphaerisporangium perillae]
MAKRKSIPAQIFAAYKKRKKEKEQAERRAQRELEQWMRQEERAEEQRQRQAAKAKQEWERKAAAEQREREQAEAARLRQEARQTREAAQAARAAESERKRQAIERRMADAKTQTEEVYARIAALEGLLTARIRDLRDHSRLVEQIFNSGGIDAFTGEIEHLLMASTYPNGFPRRCKVVFQPEARELLIDLDLPRRDIVPVAVGYRYAKPKNDIVPEPRKDAETKQLYADAIARVALRTLAETFDASPIPLVDAVVFSGYVDAKDKATGQPIRPCLLSVRATRELFDELVLDEPELDPVVCLRRLNAIVSPHPYDLEPVRPVVQFDLSKYKFGGDRRGSRTGQPPQPVGPQANRVRAPDPPPVRGDRHEGLGYPILQGRRRRRSRHQRGSPHRRAVRDPGQAL